MLERKLEEAAEPRNNDPALLERKLLPALVAKKSEVALVPRKLELAEVYWNNDPALEAMAVVK